MNTPSPAWGDPGPHLVHDSLMGRAQSMPQTQLTVVTNRHTHRHTDHATSVAIGRINALRACDAVY